MKNYTVALIREMQIKTIMTYIMPFKVAIIQKEKTPKITCVHENLEKSELLCIASKNAKWQSI